MDVCFLEYYLQVVWPELNVNVVSTTEQWAGAAIAGPKSREVLQKLFPSINVSNEGLPFMGYVEGNLFGVNARIHATFQFTGDCPGFYLDDSIDSMKEILHEYSEIIYDYNTKSKIGRASCRERV